MTLSEVVAVAGSVEILALLVVLAALGPRVRSGTRLALGARTRATRERGRKAA
jgi:hypothetical protein